MDYRNENIWLMQGDCLERMKEIPDGSVDMVMCDLPYGTTQNKWDSVIPFEPLWEQYERVCKGAIVLTAAQPFSSALVMSNPGMFKYQWTWVKSKITGVLNAKRMPVRKHEQVLVFSRRPTTYNAQGLVAKGTTTRQGNSSANYGARNSEQYVQEWTNWPRDVLEIPSEGKTVHPTQKPVALMEYLIRTYTNEGETVLDNCMGSGTTGVACVNTNRKFIGIEMDEGYFEIGVNRIKDCQFEVPDTLDVPEGGWGDEDWEDDEEDETEYGPDSVVSSKLCPPPVHPNTTLPQWIQQFQNCVVSPEKLTQMVDGVYALAKGRMMYELLLDELDKLNCYIDESGQVQLILPPPTE